MYKSLIVLGTMLLLFACRHNGTSDKEMLSILKVTNAKLSKPENSFSPSAKLKLVDSLLASPGNAPQRELLYWEYLRATVLLELGLEQDAVIALNILEPKVNPSQKSLVLRELAIAHLRLGERTNCISNHAAESCLLPIRGMGIHRDITGSSSAIDIYMKMLSNNPEDIESKWLLNLAYMTMGEYPQKVPAPFLISGLHGDGDTSVRVNPFQDIAADLKLDTRNMAGGSIVDDFDNDGFLDLVTSSMDLAEAMFYFKNNGDGTFVNLSVESGLSRFTGGLNMMQTDYNNDGFKDIFVTRGGWKGIYGEEPNSLLRNNGDGTFTDVTISSGLLSFNPTQTATWNDFNNDGWLDVFIGNETGFQRERLYPCELYINNGDGTFRNIAETAKCNFALYVKGVTSGDYDNDGWVDLFISTMNGKRLLLRNSGQSGSDIIFEDVSSQAGIDIHHGNSFPTWFWDFDNDGWLDIYACDYTFTKSLAYYLAAEKLNLPEGNPEKMLLYRNNHDGTFTNVAEEMGLNKVSFAMGANFGDIDYDGFLDMYLGTGNPQYQSLVPNKMFKSIGGKKFADVTTSARVGHLQKGHGVSFADMDHDGDQDVYIELGGAYTGDAYQNSFFVNPGQSNNNWIYLTLEGIKANTAAIGSRIKISFRENGAVRSLYRDVNSGGSFGSSPLRREIGIGQATLIDEIEIHWRGSNIVQKFFNIKPNQFIKIREGESEIKALPLKKIEWKLTDPLCLPELAYSN